MGRGSKVFVTTVFFLGFSFTALPTANAYIDPGSGSFIFQVLIGAALGAALAVKAFWRRIVGFFSRRGRPSE
ncbi:MAG TPA: hypothetical protein VJN50_07805 [Actinomycetota bacterium]|nr:hypothetical protein [Actinomycetota bacterium]